jgi:hypothetical protein
MTESKHHYEILLRKGDLLIEVASDDDYFAAKQMDRWLHALASAPATEVALPAPPPPAILPPPPPPAPVENQVEKPPETTVTEPSQPDPPPVENPVETKIPQPEPEPAPPPAPLQEAEVNDFEAVMDSLMQDLDPDEMEATAEASGGDGPSFAVLEPAKPEPPRPEPLPKPIPKPNPTPLPLKGFAGLPESEPDLEMVESLPDLYDRAGTDEPEHRLILAAYYINRFENLEKFSLKTLNAAILKAGRSPVNHSVLEATLSQGLVSLVPDLTGTAEVNEYALTEEGSRQSQAML